MKQINVPDCSYGMPQAWKKQPAKAGVILTMKFDSVFIKFCVCDEKSNLLSWAIRPVFWLL